MKTLTLKQLLTLASDYYEDGCLQEYFDKDGNRNYKYDSSDSLAILIISEIVETFVPNKPRDEQLATAIERLQATGNKLAGFDIGKVSGKQILTVAEGLENCYLFAGLTR